MLGGLQGRSGRVRNFSPTHEFDPRNVQPLASRYADYAERFNIMHTVIWCALFYSMGDVATSLVVSVYFVRCSVEICRRERLWPNAKCRPHSWLSRLRETAKDVSEVI
jgi:hypothetical protein